jgi:GH25 family lysozyme M1 (1,4-beta-N-acetylmuramidase)
MYIGGTANYPTKVQNQFINDGIEDLANTDAKDFSTQECYPDPKMDNQLARNNEGEDKFPYRTVRAFKVKFGEQNQSMFTSIKIDSKEYPETNESIQILSRLVGDNKEHAIPKGQNLYNLYENRSYKATITGLGNAMIQPTQYFQLENVPLFNGAYIILSVEHNITPNMMTTTFSGTKILKYPIPRVKNPLAFVGYDGGESEMTSLRELSSGQLVAAAEAESMTKVRLAQLNSVFGVDVSHWQEDINWNALANPTNEEDPKPKFAIIKVTQGTTYIDKKASKNANGAKAAGLKIGYYHYAQQYTGSDIVNDAKAQAQFFLSNVATLPKPDFPLVLDIEDNKPQNKLWSLIKANNDLWINTFVNELKANGYDTILYGNRYFFQDKTSNNFGSIPLWHAEYLQTPEVSNPTIASGWKDWKIWQFSSKGKVNGYGGNIDINAMKESFYNKYA